MDIKFLTNAPEYENEYMDVLRAYHPYVNLTADGAEVVLNVYTKESGFSLEISSELLTAPKVALSYEYPEKSSDLEKKRLTKRHTKRELYAFIGNITGVRLPYGALTGIRPTKLYYDLSEEGLNAMKELKDFFMVEDNKINVISEIISQQKGIYRAETNKIDYFVNIPFCPSRCSYCSFISEVVGKAKGRLQQYTEALIRDIKCAEHLLPERRAMYVGGGTPTSIPPLMLNNILSSLKPDGGEFTVEAGRPDTLSEEVIEVLKANKVTRISVNPQSFKQRTLDLIGRRHTVQDIFTAYDRVRKMGDFDINMDLITMLPEESYEDFCQSLDTAVSMKPENITVHSLSIKRGSILAEAGYDTTDLSTPSKMSDYAYDTLLKNGYMPYYMYRQKNTAGRLENIGYTLKGKVCKYNVDIMEETHSIYASGAGAISKRLFGEGRIERFADVKDIKGYIERIDEMISKKVEFFK